MFDSNGDWDSAAKDTKLSDALFGEVVLSENVNFEKNKPAEKINEPTEKLTREQWKRRQKNKRRARKRNCKESDSNNRPQSGENRDTDHVDTNKDSRNLVPCDKSKSNKKQRTKHKLADKLAAADEPHNVKIIKTDDGNTDKEIDIPCDVQKPGGLQEKLMSKLNSSRFRFINEQMYTSHSEETISLFKSDPQAFTVYHKGYLNQVSKWPVKPLDVIISWIKTRSPKLVVADFGCGEAFLAQNVRNVVHSFDLVAVNKFVTVADISKVPLQSQTVDVAVFCLSLMGTNFVEFLLEANRVLKIKAVLKIAEVASRFKGTKEFIQNLRRLGFELIKKDISNSHFYMFDFRKTKHIDAEKFHKDDLPKLKLQPCLYKKR